jgi:probable F420-dependent oxidoreductase
MRAYLDAMAAAPYMAPAPGHAPKVILAALGPKMLELAAERADGAHPYNTSPEHTAEARRILGAGKLLCVEQAAILETDASKARQIARGFLAMYLALPNYVNHWKRQGFRDADVSGGGSDRLIDDVIVWGDEARIRQRIDAHFAAGADHVCVQALGAPVNRVSTPDEKLLQLLAPKPG